MQSLPIKLDVRNVSHRFARQNILESISFTLHTGKSTVFLGPSGVGKTTLFRICADLIEAEKGKLTRYYTNLGYMFQSPRLLPWQTAFENMALALKARHTRSHEIRERVIHTAKMLGLTADDLTKYPYQLSGGMQSRVAMARALIIQPDVLSLDEPFTGLDIGLKSELMQVLKAELQKGTAILLITHELADAVELADQILLLSGEPGKIIESITIDTPVHTRDPAVLNHELQRLMTNPKVAEAFALKKGFL
ncbi:MAG TPA: ATP-binding cassette domain-containing protein [Turneriella sp.]|nr:ATP-binding cassette domain-containing protein [Turneriella sp.]